MTSKSINTLREDIFDLFRGPHEVSSENLESFKQAIAESVKESLETAGVPRKFTLRMSNIGTPDRKLWYNSRTEASNVAKPQDQIKFLFGHMIEALVLLLVKEAGHSVSEEQKEVEIEGVVGHKDCNIDDCVFDVKSASSFSFNKYTGNGMLVNDTFGYGYQLKAYYESEEQKSDTIGWVIVDKQHGEINVTTFEAFELPDATTRIRFVKEMLANETPPGRCYELDSDDKGNKLIPKLCEWCPHLTNENNCWDSPRAFQYSNGTRFYKHVEKTPRVKEVTDRFFPTTGSNHC